MSQNERTSNPFTPHLCKIVNYTLMFMLMLLLLSQMSFVLHVSCDQTCDQMLLLHDSWTCVEGNDRVASFSDNDGRLCLSLSAIFSRRMQLYDHCCPAVTCFDDILCDVVLLSLSDLSVQGFTAGHGVWWTPHCHVGYISANDVLSDDPVVTLPDCPKQSLFVLMLFVA